eukprot:TRINITY_DN4575_c0_g1_i1.p1 TRINITY_DN4575_c0_g1~~TRINITY_DN4575_c0_g1_i1.p1  ORF type:complete len:257 (+),score=51.32 TRINITY_DN4575_c0_g1_i1:116-886(+)
MSSWRCRMRSNMRRYVDDVTVGNTWLGDDNEGYDFCGDDDDTYGIENVAISYAEAVWKGLNDRLAWLVDEGVCARRIEMVEQKAAIDIADSDDEWEFVSHDDDTTIGERLNGSSGWEVVISDDGDADVALGSGTPFSVAFRDFQWQREQEVKAARSEARKNVADEKERIVWRRKLVVFPRVPINVSHRYMIPRQRYQRGDELAVGADHCDDVGVDDDTDSTDAVIASEGEVSEKKKRRRRRSKEGMSRSNCGKKAR